METYTAFLVNASGRYIEFASLRCESDDEAIKAASAYRDEMAVELWCHGRFVARIDNRPSALPPARYVARSP